MNDTDLSFPEMKTYDEFFIDKNRALFHKNSHFKASFVIWDIKKYDELASLLWTHQAPCQSLFEKFTVPRKLFYIIRDGRAVVNSWMHYAVSPRMLQRHPQYKITRVEDLYTDLEYFQRLVKRWTDHIAGYLDSRDLYRPIFYEDLIADRSLWVRDIAESLEIFDEPAIEAAIRVSDFNRTKLEAPGHARSGKNMDWSHYFSAQHEKIYEQITSEITRALDRDLYIR